MALRKSESHACVFDANLFPLVHSNVGHRTQKHITFDTTDGNSRLSGTPALPPSHPSQCVVNECADVTGLCPVDPLYTSYINSTQQV
jgi:hypothetical protein